MLWHLVFLAPIELMSHGTHCPSEAHRRSCYLNYPTDALVNFPAGEGFSYLFCMCYYPISWVAKFSFSIILRFPQRERSTGPDFDDQFYC